jgi:hypothetical protein
MPPHKTGDRQMLPVGRFAIGAFVQNAPAPLNTLYSGDLELVNYRIIVFI